MSSFKQIAEKIETAESFLIFSIGDSITEGAKSSSPENNYTAVFARGLSLRFPERTVIRYDGKRHKDSSSELLSIATYGEPITVSKGETKGGKITVVRSGIGGNTVRRILNRSADFVKKSIDGKYADLFIISVGINDSIKSDASKYVSTEKYTDDLAELTGLINQNHPQAEIIFMTPTWRDKGESNISSVDEYASAMTEFAAKRGIPVVDQHKKWIEHFLLGAENYGQGDWLVPKPKGDICHPSDTGHAAMAEELLRCIFG